MSNERIAERDNRKSTEQSLMNSNELRSTIYEISQMLNTGLQPPTINICIKLLEYGLHPQMLAEVILNIRHEIKASEAVRDENEKENFSYDMHMTPTKDE